MSSAEDGYCSADSAGDEPLAAAAESRQSKRERDVPSPSSPLPAAKRSRRSVEKRVVSVRIGECGDRAKGASGEGPPPADSWAWRKYGQKPIKGSPYPRPALYTSAPTLDAAPLLPPEEWERELQGEDALFAGLGELPECAFVFGRHRELSLATTAPCS
ncbi:hypothetical protein PR202_ga09653 [Eleusine coracana subsp. coracana]|uniref:WRKY domain-containing protein n=1 Tax=Eleusine coracana subsp. coracana TaxID=191504 RepID=A0AAV5C4P8_ELECO|nr:hypothetical protein PR202_ga09653 [Eleusine coracana subsp. coracana]